MLQFKRNKKFNLLELDPVLPRIRDSVRKIENLKHSLFILQSANVLPVNKMQETCTVKASFMLIHLSCPSVLINYLNQMVSSRKDFALSFRVLTVAVP